MAVRIDAELAFVICPRRSRWSCGAQSAATRWTGVRIRTNSIFETPRVPPISMPTQEAVQWRRLGGAPTRLVRDRLRELHGRRNRARLLVTLPQGTRVCTASLAGFVD